MFKKKDKIQEYFDGIKSKLHQMWSYIPQERIL